MQAFYNITEALRTQLSGQQITTVSMGNISEVDMQKQTLYPIAHIMVNSATIGKQTIDFDVSIIYADIVDVSNETAKEGTPFYGNDNRQDVLNAMLAEANITAQHLMRGDLWADKYQVMDNPTCDPFTERFTNQLAGWMMSFVVSTPNIDTSICA